MTVIRQREVLSFGPEPLQRRKVGHRAVVGGDDAESPVSSLGNRRVHVAIPDNEYRAVGCLCQRVDPEIPSPWRAEPDDAGREPMIEYTV